MEDVKFIRLITGEDIITGVKAVDEDNKYTLVNPLKIVYVIGDRSGVISIGLVQWVFPDVVATQELPLRQTDILTMADPSPDMLKSYRSSLKRLEKNLSFEFLTEEQEQIDDEEFVSEDYDVLDELIESMKKRDKGRLH